MKRTNSYIRLAANILGVALVTGSASAIQIIGPHVAAVIDDQIIQLPRPVSEDGGKTYGWNLSEPIQIFNEAGNLEAEITGFSGEINTDPFIACAVAITDIGAPSSFGLMFFTPVGPMASPGTATTSFSGSVTDGGDGTVDFTALPPFSAAPTDGLPNEALVFNVGLPLTNPGLDLGPTITGIPLTGGSGTIPATAGIAPLPAGVWTALQLDLSFMGSGDGDFYALTGKVETVAGAVPDTGSSLILLLMGCGAVTFLARSRKV